VPTFTVEDVDLALPGAAFSVAEDVVGDARPELVVSSFGQIVGSSIPHGSVEMYERHGRGWRRTTIVPAGDGIDMPGEPTFVDVNADGRLDVIVPGGFFICQLAQRICGSLHWYEQRADRTWARHVVVPTGAALFYHRALPLDLTGDGRVDLVTVGETLGSAHVQVFPGVPGGFATTPVELGQGLGSLPVAADVDRDGDLDLASAQYFARGVSAAWLERVAPPTAATPAGSWVRHVISSTEGGAIELAPVPGVGWVLSNHTNTTSGPPGTPTSGIYRYTPGVDVRAPWTPELLSSGIVSRSDTALGNQQGAPGVFGWGDVDGDGDTDLGVSGDGDRHVFVLLQRADGTFETLPLADQMGQAGGGVIVDTDHDHRAEVLFSSYDCGCVRLYEYTVAS
jgi:hypothetical protein